jgi:hypothetical protein
MGRRLARQHLLDPASDPVAAASRLGGVHAQVALGAALIVGIRTTGSPLPTSTMRCGNAGAW